MNLLSILGELRGLTELQEKGGFKSTVFDTRLPEGKPELYAMEEPSAHGNNVCILFVSFTRHTGEKKETLPIFLMLLLHSDS